LFSIVVRAKKYQWPVLKKVGGAVLANTVLVAEELQSVCAME
jgi:hypothetical protein